MRIRKIFMILLGGLMISSVSLMAHEGHEKEHAESNDQSANLSATWHEIKEHEKKLEETIKAGKLEEVHEIAFSIRDLTKSLFEESKGHPGIPVGMLMVNINQVAAIAESLDEYGDASDKQKTEAEFEKLKSILNAIEKQYPNGTLN